MSRCPRTEQVDAVLERSLEDAAAEPIRAHVASCERCLERHGASFELALWGEELVAALPASMPRRSKWLRLRRAAGVAAAAAAIVLGAALARERSPIREHADGAGAGPIAPPRVEAVADPPRLQVFELVTTVGTRGPDGERVTRTVQRSFEPALIHVSEARVDRAGVVQRHERVLPLAAVVR